MVLTQGASLAILTASSTRSNTIGGSTPAITYGEIGTIFTTAGSSSWVIDSPDNVVPSTDVLVLALAHSNQASVPTPSANWTEFTGSPRATDGAGSYLRMYWRYAAASPATSYTWGWSVSNGGVAAIFRLSNANQTDPFDGLAFNNGGFNTSAVGTAVSPATTTAILFNVAISAGARTFTPPGSVTAEPIADQGGGPSMNMVYKQLSASGTTGNLTHTVSSATNWATVMFALKGA